MKKAKKAAASKQAKNVVVKATPNATDQPKRLGCLSAAVKVLEDAGQPMNAKAMIDAMLAKSLWTTGGKTPASTLYAALIREIAAKGDKSRFKKTDRGLFGLNT